jgi:hypothetical protein
MILGDADVDDILNPSVSIKQLLQTTHYALDLFNKSRVSEVVDLPWTQFLMTYPTTDQGVRWQVRAYSVKKKSESLHNFTYIDTDLIARHKQQFGELSWIKVNTYNFYQNVLEYVQNLKQKSWPMVPLEWLLDQSMWPELINFIQEHFKIKIDFVQATQLLQAWTDLHWPVAETDCWEHVDIFDGYRSEFSDQCIKWHSL